MISRILFAIVLPLIISCSFTANKNEKLKTNKYAGKYSYGENIDQGPVGSMFIYPETDSTVLFFLDLSRGAPSYNLGQLYGRLKINDDSGLFHVNYDWTEESCKWNAKFSKEKVVVKTIEDQYSCGFGYGVDVDGEYKKETSKKPVFFINGHGDKVFFEKTKPENYLK